MTGVDRRRRHVRGVVLVLALLGVSACSQERPTRTETLARSSGGVATSAPPTTAATPAPPSPAAAPPPELATTARPAATTRLRPRTVVTQAYTPFATVEAVTLHHPSLRVERVGFHQSNHEGAREMLTSRCAARPVVLESRDRLAGSQSAADIVVDPAAEIRSPVTGTVKRAGTYVLYCKYSDDYVVIEPDAHPGWEVKILHISGEQVSPGEHVVAGQTVLAPRATPLPFASQVDELRSADPAWPHVHVEVVDPTIRNVPSPGGGCS